jgi:hypothetical protein
MSSSKYSQLGYVKLGGKNRGKRFGGAGSGGGGGGSTGLRAAFNLPGIDQYNGVFAYADLIKHTSNLWTSAAFPGGIPTTNPILNANHFPSALAAGTNCTLLVYYSLENVRSVAKVKPGSYKITWTATGAGGCSVSVSGSGITNVVVNIGTSTTTFDIPNGNVAYDMFLTVVNSSGSTAGADAIKIYHTTHETALLAGDPLHPDFVAELQSWPYLHSVRFLDMQATNTSNVVNAADWTTLAHQSYTRPTRGAPPEVIGWIGSKLASTVGLWLTMARTATNAAMSNFYQRVKAVEPSGTRKIHCEGINEAWNSGFQNYDPLGTTDYIGLTVVDLNNSPSSAFNDRLTASYMQHAFRCWSLAETEFGISRVVRTVGVQTDFYAFMAAWIHYRDTTVSNLYGGATALALMNPGTGRPDGELAFTWYFYSYNASPIKQRIIDDFGGQTDAVCKAAWITDIDNNRTVNYLPGIANYRSRGYTGKITTYEGACHDFWDKHDAGTSINIGTGNTGTNTLDFPDNFWIYPGNQASAPNQGSPVSGVAAGAPFYVRRTGTTSLYCYTSLANYNADIAGGSPGSRATVVAGTYNVINYSFANRAASFFGLGNVAAKTVSFATDGVGWITDGDLLITPNQGCVVGVTFPGFFYVRKTGTSVYCYLTLADYTADAGGASPSSRASIATNNLYYFANQTRFARFSDKMASIYKGTVGQEIVQYVVDNNLKHPNVLSQCINLFVAFSNDRNNQDRFIRSFDVHNNTLTDNDTPIITYLKGLTGL